MQERDIDRPGRPHRDRVTGPARALLLCLFALLALGSVGCVGLSYPELPPETSGDDAASDAAGALDDPEPPPAVVAAREMEATSQTWASLAAEGRNAFKVGNLEGAEEAYLAAVSLTAEYDPDDVRSRTALSNLVRLAGMYQSRGRYEDAGRVISRVVAESLNGRHPDFGVSAPIMISQGGYLERNGRLNEAIRIFEAGLASAPRSSLGSRERMLMQRGLALAYIEEGRPADAAPLLDDLLARSMRTGNGKTATHAALLVDMAKLREAENNIAAAEARLLEAVALYRELDPKSGPLAGAINRLAWLYVENDRADEAIPLSEEALAILDGHGVSGPSRAAFLDTLASAQSRIGHDSQAEASFRQAIEERDKGTAETKESQASIVENYSAFLRKLGRGDDAAKLDARLAAERASAEATELKAEAAEMKAEAAESKTEAAEESQAPSLDRSEDEPGTVDSGDAATGGLTEAAEDAPAVTASDDQAAPTSD